MVGTPIFLATITTMAGFVSLVWTEVVPMRHMGIFVTLGIGYAGFRNPTALTAIIDDLEAWCDDRGIDRVSDLIGAVRDDDMEMDTLAAASVGV